jgi:hypothetical protein
MVQTFRNERRVAVSDSQGVPINQGELIITDSPASMGFPFRCAVQVKCSFVRNSRFVQGMPYFDVRTVPSRPTATQLEPV